MRDSEERSFFSLYLFSPLNDQPFPGNHTEDVTIPVGHLDACSGNWTDQLVHMKGFMLANKALLMSRQWSLVVPTPEDPLCYIGALPSFILLST